jgi:F-type H+-transporting ATPase subunit epsilon
VKGKHSPHSHFTLTLPKELMADEGKIRLRLVTPERILVEDDVDAVELPATTGYMEVLYGHAPLLAELGAGDVTLHGGKSSGKDARYNVSWGFVEVLPDRVTILANNAVEPSKIDVSAAEKQLEEGRDLWNKAGDSEEAYAEANHVIHEAEAKIASAKG